MTVFIVTMYFTVKSEKIGHRRNCCIYRNDPNFSDRQVWANRVDPDQTASRVYTVCHSICIFWTRYSVVKRHCSNFRMFTGFLLFTTVWFYCTLMHPKDADRLAKGVDPDQTAFSGAAWAAHSITSHYHSYWLPVMILTAAGKMAFRYNGAQIIYAVFTDVVHFEAGFCCCI